MKMLPILLFLNLITTASADYEMREHTWGETNSYFVSLQWRVFSTVNAGWTLDLYFDCSAYNYQLEVIVSSKLWFY